MKVLTEHYQTKYGELKMVRNGSSGYEIIYTPIKIMEMYFNKVQSIVPKANSAYCGGLYCQYIK